ncbi:YciI family protein [Nocardioides sp. NPDC006303]|uniref:YciI family protein n=1 Tax=Nocardioides sp. NPDC006303 TaxID=3156747 RepID=UPI0033BA622F
MRYLLLLGGPDHHARWDALPEEQTQAAYADFSAFAKAVAERGELIDGDALQPPTTSLTVHEDGAVTDGPFAESVEQLGGYYVIDVPTIDDAVALAKLLPKHFAVEIRPTQGVQIR